MVHAIQPAYHLAVLLGASEWALRD